MKKTLISVIALFIATLALSASPASATKHRDTGWVADYLQPSCVVEDSQVQVPLVVTRPSSANSARFLVNWVSINGGPQHTKTVKFYGSTGYFAIVMASTDSILFNVTRLDGTVLTESGVAGAAFCA